MITNNNKCVFSVLSIILVLVLLLQQQQVNTASTSALRIQTNVRGKSTATRMNTVKLPSAEDSNQQHPIMYEVSTRPWLYELSQKYGKTLTKLLDIPDEEFLALKGMFVVDVFAVLLYSPSN
jgi:hypothetical protein